MVAGLAVSSTSVTLWPVHVSLLDTALELYPFVQSSLAAMAR